MARPIQSTTDAFGEEIKAGAKVIYYTGNEACLKRGEVKRILETTSYGHTYHRVMITPDNQSSHEANISPRLCVVEERADDFGL